MNNKYAVRSIEYLGTGLDHLRFWAVKAWRIAILIAKGSYLVGERRNLFRKLGEQTYESTMKGQLAGSNFDSMIQQLERVTKKIELEEMLIRNIRFGSKDRSSRNPLDTSEGTDNPKKNTESTP